MGFPGGASGKEPACQHRRPQRCGFDPWVGKIPGGGHGNPLQYSCLENPVDRRAWRATVHRVTKSQTQLKQLSTDTRDREQTTLLPEFCVELESFVPTGPLVRVYLLGVSRQIGVSSFGS